MGSRLTEEVSRQLSEPQNTATISSVISNAPIPTAYIFMRLESTWIHLIEKRSYIIGIFNLKNQFLITLKLRKQMMSPSFPL